MKSPTNFLGFLLSIGVFHLVVQSGKGFKIADGHFVTISELIRVS